LIEVFTAVSQLRRLDDLIIALEELPKGGWQVEGAVLALDDLPEGITLAAPVELAVEVRAARGGQFRVGGHVKATLTAPCDSCLDPFTFEVEEDFDRLVAIGEESGFFPQVEAGEEGIPIDDLPDLFLLDGQLKLTELAREEVLVAIPPLLRCSSECQGLCPYCALNRNLESCACAEGERRKDSPFAGLAEMLEAKKRGR